MVTGTNLLHVAARHKDLTLWNTLKESVVFAILKDSADKRGTTPLIAAAWYDNFIAVTYLLTNGADTSFTMWDTGMTCLHVAAELPQSEICKEILKYNCKKLFINAFDSDGDTPLMLSVMNDSPSMYVLLENGADYRTRNRKTGRNILHNAVVTMRFSTIEYLIDNYPEEDFLDATDVNGNTPLQLAILLLNLSIVTCLLHTKFGSELIGRTQSQLHYIVRKNRVDILREILDNQPNKTFFNILDPKGRTILIHAVELGRSEIVQLLIEHNIDFRIRNQNTGETVLHAAAYTNDDKMLDLILGIHRIEEIFEVVDNNGIIPYELVLGKVGYRVWMKFFKTGYITRDFFNENHESSLFIAAKEGNYYLVRCLLLSDKFHNYCPNIYHKTEIEIRSLELQGKIYPSDVYIMTNAMLPYRGWNTAPNETSLFQHNYEGQNIFHACALGESIDCITFMYNYCSLFNESALNDFDAPDRFGNTPFTFAVVSGSLENSKFFMSKGASLAHVNAVGQTPLDAMYVKLPRFQTMLLEVINECAVVDCQTRKGDMVINYGILFPKGRMDVISFIHQKLRGGDNIEILKSVVLEYFVLYKWNRFKDVIGMRFFLYALKVISFSTYLTFSLCLFLELHKQTQSIFWWITFFLTLLIFFFTLPIMFMRKFSYFLLVFAGPLLTLIYLLAHSKSRISIEIGAFAILFSWFSVMVQGYASNISFQISMFFEVCKSVVPHLPLCVLVLFAFSHCFFTLFHDYVQFNNPLHSFIFTATILMEKENFIPTFLPKEHAIHKNDTMYLVQDPVSHSVNGFKEMRNVLIEGPILVLYDVLICICILNMLVGLAVRSGEELEQGGKINRLRIYVEEISAWEQFVDTKVYKYLVKLKLCLLFGFPTNLKQMLTVATVFHPLSEPPVEDFDLPKLRYVAVDIEDLEPRELKSLKYLADQEKGRQSTERLRRGSVAASNMPWVFG